MLDAHEQWDRGAPLPCPRGGQQTASRTRLAHPTSTRGLRFGVDDLTRLERDGVVRQA